MDAHQPPDPAFAAVAHAIAYLKFDAVSRFPGDGYACRVLDPLGRVVAVLHGDLDLDTKDVSAFDFAVRHARTGGGELLPVRPEPEPQPPADPVDQSDNEPLPLTISHSTPDGVHYTTTVSHYHGHRHGAVLRVPGEPPAWGHAHAHVHAHRGVDSTGGWYYGHADAPHDDHQHDG